MRARIDGFRRARLMMAAIAAVFTQFGAHGATPNMAKLDAELKAIGPYVSRGKGQGGAGGNKHSRRCVAFDKRAARKARNRARHRAHL